MALRALLRILVTGGLGVWLFGCSAGSESADRGPTDETRNGAESQPLRFVPDDGWHTVETRLNDGTPVAWVANRAFFAEDASGAFPEATIAQLPAGGIVMVAVGPRPYEGDAAFDRLDLPLQLSDGQVLTESYDGQPAPHVSYFYADTRVGEDLLNVWGYIGESPPRASATAEANRMLAALRLAAG